MEKHQDIISLREEIDAVKWWIKDLKSLDKGHIDRKHIVTLENHIEVLESEFSINESRNEKFQTVGFTKIAILIGCFHRSIDYVGALFGKPLVRRKPK